MDFSVRPPLLSLSQLPLLPLLSLCYSSRPPHCMQLTQSSVPESAKTLRAQASTSFLSLVLPPSSFLPSYPCPLLSFSPVFSKLLCSAQVNLNVELLVQEIRWKVTSGGLFSLSLKLRLSAGQVKCIVHSPQVKWSALSSKAGKDLEWRLIWDCYWHQCSVRYISEWKSARMGTCFEVANSPGIGRYLVATRDIKPLELVLVFKYDMLYRKISCIRYRVIFLTGTTRKS